MSFLFLHIENSHLHLTQFVPRILTLTITYMLPFVDRPRFQRECVERNNKLLYYILDCLSMGSSSRLKIWRSAARPCQ
ncbi:unnamed protein product [Coffea canephora]|uniref:Uncharacterized protein n=1 Tax=Coffea canephora TaxID=49390 RepID=A0A068UXT8_COFCA|nr:unnamed protein product [Coffea canephora]